MECYNEAIRIDPSDINTYNEIGDILNYNDKRYEEAVKYYNDSVRNNPNCATYYANNGHHLKSLDTD